MLVLPVTYCMPWPASYALSFLILHVVIIYILCCGDKRDYSYQNFQLKHVGIIRNTNISICAQVYNLLGLTYKSHMRGFREQRDHIQWSRG